MLMIVAVSMHNSACLQCTSRVARLLFSFCVELGGGGGGGGEKKKKAIWPHETSTFPFLYIAPKHITANALAITEMHTKCTVLSWEPKVLMVCDQNVPWFDPDHEYIN